MAADNPLTALAAFVTLLFTVSDGRLRFFVNTSVTSMPWQLPIVTCHWGH